MYCQQMIQAGSWENETISKLSLSPLMPIHTPTHFYSPTINFKHILLLVLPYH